MLSVRLPGSFYLDCKNALTSFADSAPSVPRDAADRLIDRFGRAHRSLRISVIDRCNIRCFYCMPEHVDNFLPRADLLSFDEIVRVVGLLATAGVSKIRLTGGEPLLRPNLDALIARIAAVSGVEEIALTTNGILLPSFAQSLKAAGLQRLNISLDTLNEATFQRISRRSGVDRVIAGIDHAIDLGFEQIRLNALAIRGLTETEIVPLVDFARRRNLTLRFIEYMPLDADRAWRDGDVLTGDAIRQRLESQYGPLLETGRDDPAQPAIDYRFADGSGRVGFINPVSKPFCIACDRLRLTADGGLRNCLFSDRNWDLRSLLRSGASDADLINLITESVAAKEAGHLISRPGFQQPQRAMYQIGG
ncbi:Cyclic pyranopterin monophosphate synthase 1 [Rosistilla oblonga]|nr:Cyclic pyranopterin monophosphate synthase 1 [Rosistilla oblonga]